MREIVNLIVTPGSLDKHRVSSTWQNSPISPPWHCEILSLRNIFGDSSPSPAVCNQFLLSTLKSLLSSLINPKMSNESEPVANAVVAPITYSVFDPRNSYVWFSQASEDNPYDTLKRAVISGLSDSQEKRVQQLLSQVELGDRTTS
ncbi:hypothetical protein ACTXT7_006557 [Hymenolepis weldensis]